MKILCYQVNKDVSPNVQKSGAKHRNLVHDLIHQKTGLRESSFIMRLNRLKSEFRHGAAQGFYEVWRHVTDLIVHGLIRQTEFDDENAGNRA
jgi:hypothetical protein